MRKLAMLLAMCILAASFPALSEVVESEAVDEVVGEAFGETGAPGLIAEPEGDAPERAFEELKKGSRGDAVAALQEKLIELGYLKGSADGDYGNKTVNAVKAFQRAVGLKPTGVADEETQAKLYE